MNKWVCLCFWKVSTSPSSLVLGKKTHRSWELEKQSITEHILESILYSIPSGVRTPSFKATKVDSKMASCALRKHCHLVATTSCHRHKDLKVPLTLWKDTSDSAQSSKIPCIYIAHYTLHCAFYVYCYLTFQGSSSFYRWGNWGSERKTYPIIL